MRNALTIFKKEMRRFFTDPRMLLALFLPGILIFILYSVMGRLINTAITEDHIENTTYRLAYTDNSGSDNPLVLASYQAYLGSSDEEKTNKAEFTAVPVSSTAETKTKVKSGEIDVFLVFSDDFENKVHVQGENPLNTYLYIYYNGSAKGATHAYSTILSISNTVYKNYVINIDQKGSAIVANLADTDYNGSRLLSILIPMLTVSILFSSVMAICPDAIAGEKERGTLSSLLLTPVKRGEIALGKISALTLTAILSGAVTFGGLMGGLPSLMEGIKVNVYPSTIALMGLLIVTSLILLVSLGTLISALAKTSKECTGWLAPFVGVAMAAGLLPLAINVNSVGWAFVPILNVTVAMNVLLSSGSISSLFMGITISVNLILTSLFILSVASLFRSERFMIK